MLVVAPRVFELIKPPPRVLVWPSTVPSWLPGFHSNRESKHGTECSECAMQKVVINAR